MTAAGMMATLVALIIGLLVTSAKDTYDVTNASITQGGAKIITLDYYLSRYGSEAKEVRELLPQSVASAIQRIWPSESTHGADLAKMEAASDMANVYNKIRELSPKNESQISSNSGPGNCCQHDTITMDVYRTVADQPAKSISCGTHILAHRPLCPIWSVGSSKPDCAIGIAYLRPIDVGRDFSYPGIKSASGGNYQGVKCPAAQSPCCNREVVP